IFIDGVKFGMPAVCDEGTEKLIWSNTTGWSCEADTAGGGGTGGAQTLEETLDAGDDAGGNSADNFNKVGANEFCNADLTACFTPDSLASGDSDIFERSGTVIRPKSGYADDDFVFGSA